MKGPAKGPFFGVDFGHGLGDPEWGALALDPRTVFAILKVSQGMAEWPKWFGKQWPLARMCWGSRYGVSGFRGAYVFIVPGDGAAQCDNALEQIDKAGGWGDGDMPLAMDIEGNAWNDDKTLRRRVSMQFAERYHKRTGRLAMFYGNGDIGIGPDDGFDLMWTPHPKRLAGWPVDRFALYQYAGLDDGKTSYYDPSNSAARKGFPLRIKGWGSSHGTDMNVVLDEKGNALLDAARLPERLLRRHVYARPPAASAA